MHVTADSFAVKSWHCEQPPQESRENERAATQEECGGGATGHLIYKARIKTHKASVAYGRNSCSTESFVIITLTHLIIRKFKVFTKSLHTTCGQGFLSRASDTIVKSL